MKPSRWSPKEYARPRSRRAREEASPDFGATDILKDLYVLDFERPVWAKLARKFGWLTDGEYFAIRPVRTGKSWVRELLYSKSPILGVIRKSTAFGVAG